MPETDLQNLTRRDRNKLRNQRAILDAALDVFGEKGYADASIQEIADRADFAVSTIYALFENKEDLYRKVSVDVGRMCGELFDAAMADGADEYEKLVLFARAKGAVYTATPAGNKMLEIELHDASVRGVAPPVNGIGHIYASFLERIQGLFASGIERGIFVDKDPRLLAITLDSMTNALMRLSRSEMGAIAYEDGIEDVIEIFFEPVLSRKRDGMLARKRRGK